MPGNCEYTRQQGILILRSCLVTCSKGVWRTRFSQCALWYCVGCGCRRLSDKNSQDTISIFNALFGFQSILRTFEVVCLLVCWPLMENQFVNKRNYKIDHYDIKDSLPGKIWFIIAFELLSKSIKIYNSF